MNLLLRSGEGPPAGSNVLVKGIGFSVFSASLQVYLCVFVRTATTRALLALSA